MLSAIVGRTCDAIYLNDDEGAVLTKSDTKLFNIFSIREMSRRGTKFRNFSNTLEFKNLKISERMKKLEWNLDNTRKENYPHFQLKEIFE